MNTINPINRLTSNQYYRGLNRRFDRRIAFLAKLGFQYVSAAITLPNGRESFTAVVWRMRYARPQVLQSSAIMRSSSREWRDMLAINLDR